MSILYVIAHLGLALYMFLVGLEFDTSLIRGRGRQAGSISASGILLPFVLGGSFALLLYHDGGLFGQQVSPAMAALFLGASMSITAFPMLARLIQQYQIARTMLGTLVLTTASVDDIAAWCLLALVLAGQSNSPVIALVTIGGGTPIGQLAALVQGTEPGRPENRLIVDFVIDCTGLEHGLEYHALLQDLVTHHQLGRNPKGRLKVSNGFEVIGMGNGDGHVYTGGIMTLGGPHAAQGSFLGLQYSVLRSVDALAALGAPGVHRINGLRSLRQWFRWARGVHP